MKHKPLEKPAGGLIVSGSWFVPVSVALLTYSAGMLLLYGWDQFGWFELAALSLIAGVTVKVLIDNRKKGPERPE